MAQRSWTPPAHHPWIFPSLPASRHRAVPFTAPASSGVRTILFGLALLSLAFRPGVVASGPGGRPPCGGAAAAGERGDDSDETHEWSAHVVVVHPARSPGGDARRSYYQLTGAGIEKGSPLDKSGRQMRTKLGVATATDDDRPFGSLSSELWRWRWNSRPRMVGRKKAKMLN